MAFMDLAKSRYSVRKFSDKPIEKEKLDAILEAGRIAPTGHNYQPYRVYLKLRTPETLMRQGFIRFSDIRQHHIMHTVSGTFPIDPAVLP